MANKAQKLLEREAPKQRMKKHKPTKRPPTRKGYRPRKRSGR